jgi:hypothetical protein
LAAWLRCFAEVRLAEPAVEIALFQEFRVAAAQREEISP